MAVGRGPNRPSLRAKLRRFPPLLGQKPHRRSLGVAAGLALLMASTRLHHFLLPDASLAVFFLVGYLLPRGALLFAFLLLAALIDWVAVGFLGVSDWCITPAYPFLIPTYGSVWWAGRSARRWSPLQVPFWGIALLSATVAFLISNLSFYAFSGYFEQMALADYFRRTARYFPPYAFSMLLYLAMVALPYELVQRALKEAQGRQTFAERKRGQG